MGEVQYRGTPLVIVPVPATFAEWQALFVRAASEPVGIPVTAEAVVVVDQRTGIGQTLEWMGTDARVQAFVRRAAAEPVVMTVEEWEQQLEGSRMGETPV